MSYRLARLNQTVKKLDPDLYVIENSSGMRQIWRKAKRKDLEGLEESGRTELSNELILALTDTFTLRGKPVDWGLEPIVSQLKSMDSWRDDRIYDDMVERRKRQEEWSKESQRHEIRARAADMRKDVARAFNDVNTSTLDKKVGRKKKWQS